MAIRSAPEKTDRAIPFVVGRIGSQSHFEPSRTPGLDNLEIIVPAQRIMTVGYRFSIEDTSEIDGFFAWKLVISGMEPQSASDRLEAAREAEEKKLRAQQFRAGEWVGFRDPSEFEGPVPAHGRLDEPKTLSERLDYWRTTAIALAKVFGFLYGILALVSVVLIFQISHWEIGVIMLAGSLSGLAIMAGMVAVLLSLQRLIENSEKD